MTNSMEYAENYSHDKNNFKEENNSEKDKVVNLTEFSKIMRDFINDILFTFPELKKNLNEDILIIYENNNTDNKDDIKLSEAFKNIYHYTKTIYPERFFDILYQNNNIFSDPSLNTNFLPDINFSKLWNLNITENTRKTMWKYIQLILFSIITTIKSENSFGNTAKLFEAIDEGEFKNKIEDTMNQMQNIFENAPKMDTSGINMNNLPDASEIHDHINGLMEGKLGKLAKEIAQEATDDLNIDPSNINNVQDVFQKLFKDPGKLMNIVKNVGNKLDQKMKNGEIKESELIQEATEMMGKMQNLPGMKNMSDILSKLNLPAFGPGAKFNKQAFDGMMNQNLKRAKTKERMKAKLDEKKNENEEKKQSNPSELEAINSNLMKLMEQLNLENIPEVMDQIQKQSSNNGNKSNNPNNTPRKKKQKNQKKK